MPPTPPGILAIPHEIGPKVTRIPVIIAIKIDDEYTALTLEMFGATGFVS